MNASAGGPVAEPTAASVLILPSGYGARPVLAAAANHLEQLGFAVTVLDLFAGQSTADPLTSQANEAEWDKEALVHHISTEIENMTSRAVHPPVLIGISWGAVAALRVAASGIPVRALVLFHDVGEIPPNTRLSVPVMIQAASADPKIPHETIQEAARSLMASGAAVQLRWQDTATHLFTDYELTKSDPSAAQIAWQQVEAFLTGLTAQQRVEVDH